MANPLILHENIFATSTATLTSTGTPASGFPIANINDWRMGTAYRWKADGTGDVHLDLDAGVGNTLEADTVFVGGHNLGTGGATISVKADTFTPPTTARSSVMNPTTDLPFGETFTTADYRYWRISIYGTPSVAAQMGVVTVGRRIDYEAGALPDLDPYNRSSNVEPYINNNGSPIGVNVRSKTKRFTMNYGSGDPGMTRDTFFAPSSGISFDDDFLPHAVDSAKPFWFAWNIAIDADEIYLCRIEGPTVAMPFVDSTLRRGLQTTFIAHRETT